MGAEELAANLFRVTQTDAKLRRDAVDNKEQANATHVAVGREMRQAILNLGGTMPEQLPTPPESVKQAEQREQREQRRIEQAARLSS